MIKINLLKGNNLETLKQLPDNSVDSIVTDPPYGLSFMGKKWDYDVPTTELWQECFRVLKHGGHLLAFFGTRTYHRGVVRIEDAGFEIRDQIQWIYGSGFPKSHNIGKAIEKINFTSLENSIYERTGYPNWQGWGTALKPANEPIVVARKPLEKGLTIAENVLKYGTGAINVDDCRIEGKLDGDPNIFKKTDGGWGVAKFHEQPVVRSEGRWPANVILDETAAEMLDEQSGILKGLGQHKQKATSIYGGKSEKSKSENLDRSEQGGASRFFYVAKASKSERNKGLEGMQERQASGLPMRSKNGERGGEGIDGTNTDRLTKNQNFHPTVKPIKLMQYLIKLVTPPNGTVLDPFMGSGSTGVAAKELGFNFVGCELSPEYFEIAEKRING